jgi:hypothetical protein
MSRHKPKKRSQHRRLADMDAKQKFGVPKGSKWMAKLMRAERLQQRNRQERK